MYIWGFCFLSGISFVPHWKIFRKISPVTLSKKLGLQHVRGGICSRHAPANEIAINVISLRLAQ